MNKSKRAYKYRIYPTIEQKQLLAQSFGCVRMVYNNTLRYRTDAFYKDNIKVSPSDAEKRLVELKKEYPFLKDVSAVILQQTLRDQQQAFKNFWDKRANYPVFKKKNSRQSFRLTKSGFSIKNGELYIAKSKVSLLIRNNKVMQENPSSITISKDCSDRYFVSMICEFNPVKLPKKTNYIGIDLGLKHLIVTSDRDKIPNPKHTKKYETKLAYFQKKLSKKKLGSSNRCKAKLKVARIHAKISDCRSNHAHKTTRKLINDNQVVCVESLNVKGMIKNPKLAKHIADANWGEIVRQLKYKADWYGREIIEIDRFFPSSKRCSRCGYINQELKLDMREWQCKECNTNHDRDINAAINIRTAGTAGLVCGATGAGIVA